MNREKSSAMPVFLFPAEMTFYLGARHTHKQLLTLYNPYQFAVDFKVLCTSSHKFSVMEPEGTIAARSCMDIVVRFTQPPGPPRLVTERFRITMLDRNTQKPLGKQDVPISLIPGEPAIDPARNPPESHPEDFQPMVTKARPEDREPVMCRHRAYGDQPVNYVAITVAIFCVAALSLPTMHERDYESQLPAWLHIGVSLKVVFSFVLGMVAMLVLRP